MSEPQVSRFPVPDFVDLPEDIRTRVEAVQGKFGANTAFFAQSHRLANLSAIRPNDEFYAMAH